MLQIKLGCCFLLVCLNAQSHAFMKFDSVNFPYSTNNSNSQLFSYLIFFPQFSFNFQLLSFDSKKTRRSLLG